MKLLAPWLVAFLLVLQVAGKITHEQMKQTGKMFRASCQPKFKLSDEIIDAVKEGVFPDDRGLKCYSNCVLEMMQTMKRGKFLYESAKKQIEQLLPADVEPFYLAALDICRDSAKGVKDNCEAAYNVIQCFYKNNPKFMVP